MITPGSKRVCQRAGVRNLRLASFYSVTGGPVGSATMMYGVVFTLLKAGNAQYWSGTNTSAGVGGWSISLGTGAFNVVAVNGAGTVISHQSIAGAFDVAANFGRTWILIGQLVGGSITSSLSNTVAAGATAVVGYTPKPAGQKVRVGVDDATAFPASTVLPSYALHDAFLFDTYDGTGFVSATFGNGLAGINAMWQEDVQQGRYLTRPAGGAYTANDTYFCAKDVVTGIGTKNTWTDRGGNALVLTKGGTLSPQGAALPMRL